jgi:hypothetical protein
MEKIIVYVDDAEYALHQLTPMEGGSAGQRQPTDWVLVACPPRMTRHINKWVNHTARENWRNKWSQKLFAQITPTLQAHGDKVTPVLSSGPLIEMTKELLAKHGAARVVDARRPKFGQDMAPVTADQPATQDARWAVPGAVVGMGAFLVLASE